MSGIDHYEMPHARADECWHVGVGKACRPCRDRFERTPITPDERAAMRERAERLHHYGGESQEASEDILKALDALDTAEYERDEESVAARLNLSRSERAEAEVARLREEAARPALMSDDSDALALLDEMNHDGRIEYADYSALHDAITAAHPAPVWDEDTVTEAVARAMFPHFFTDDRQPLRVFTETRSDAELREAERESARHRARQALAVVRERLPFRLDPKEK